MGIILTAKDAKTYKIKPAPGPQKQRTKRQIVSIPSCSTAWTTKDGVEVPSHWEVPRSDLMEILYRWDESEIVSDDKVKHDLNALDLLLTPLEEVKRFKGDISTNLQLYDYQEDYVRLPKWMRRTILCLKVGRGKTVTSLERAKRLGFKRLLIVTIQAVLDDWEEEVWSTLDREVQVYVGTKEQRKRMCESQDRFEVVLCTYESVSEVKLKDFDSFIFDECDIYASTETERWQNLKQVFQATGPKSRNCVVQQLTATPVGNQPISVWPLLWIVHPWLSGTKDSFRERFHEVQRQIEKPMPYKTDDGEIRWYKKKIDTKVKLCNAEQLRERLACCLFTYQGNAGIHFKDEERIISVPMTDVQRDAYEELKENLLAEIGYRGVRIKIKDGFSKLTRLLQCAEGLFNFDYDSRESGKLEYLCYILDRALKRGEKVVVWSRFKPITEILHEIYKDYSVIYNGDVSKSRRALAKWSFNGVKSDRQLAKFNEYATSNQWTFKPGEAQFFFGIIHSKTSRSMNLQSGAYQLFSSFSFSAYAMEQTKGRLTRVGQMAPIVKTRYLPSEDTWENPCLQYVLGKRLDAECLVNGTETVAKYQLIDLINILRAA